MSQTVEHGGRIGELPLTMAQEVVGMAREYSIGEACDELRCSRKTLNEWLGNEGIDSDDLHKGQIDKRSRMIPRSLLVTLSKKHKRPLTSDMVKRTTAGPSPDAGEKIVSTLLREVRLLRGEVDSLENDLARLREDLPALVRAQLEMSFAKTQERWTDGQKETHVEPGHTGTSEAFPSTAEHGRVVTDAHTHTSVSKEASNR